MHAVLGGNPSAAAEPPGTIKDEASGVHVKTDDTYEYADNGPSGAPNRWPEGLPPSIDAGFAVLSHGVDEKTGAAYTLITCTSEDPTERGLGTMLDFFDNYVLTQCPAAGFNSMYDVRAVSQPHVTVVKRLADWGNNPERKELWKKRNVGCKIIIEPGIRFNICSGILTTFFWICPPIVRTFLLKGPDESEAEAVCFEPGQAVPAEAPKAQAAQGRGSITEDVTEWFNSAGKSVDETWSSWFGSGGEEKPTPSRRSALASLEQDMDKKKQAAADAAHGSGQEPTSGAEPKSTQDSKEPL